MAKRTYTPEQKEAIKLRKKLYYEANKQSITEKSKQYYEANKDKVLKRTKASYDKDKKREYNVKYREANTVKLNQYYELTKVKKSEYNKIRYQENAEKIKAYSNEYKKRNKEAVTMYAYNYRKNRYETDILYRLKETTRKRIQTALRLKGFNKPSKTTEILGCTIEEFKQHLESKFESWMSWDNYGLYNGTPNYGWDIDHKIPNSSALTEQEVVQLNHYTNLQPLCSYYNRDVKRNKV